MEDISKIISDARKKCGLSAEDLAKKVGVSKQTIYRYENGEINNIRRDKLGKLADALNIDVSLLLGVSVEPNPLNRNNNKDFNELFFSLSEEQQKIVLDLMKTIKGGN